MPVFRKQFFAWLLLLPMVCEPDLAFSEYVPSRTGSSSVSRPRRCEGLVQSGRTQKENEGNSLEDLLNQKEFPLPNVPYLVDPKVYPNLAKTIGAVVFHESLVRDLKKSAREHQGKFWGLMLSILNGEVSGEGQNGIKRAPSMPSEFRLIKKIQSHGKFRLIAVVKGRILYIVEHMNNDELSAKDSQDLGKRALRKVENIRRRLN